MDESAKRELARVLRGDMQFQNFVVHPGIDIGSGIYPPAFGFLGLDKKYPGYDGKKLPFPDEHFATVHSSHCLEHVDNAWAAILEWFRVLKTGGHLLLYVPHKYLYEKKEFLPSRFNKDHKRFYTPATLLEAIEDILDPNTYRLIYCRDNDSGYDYTIPPEQHASGCYEIECVIKKIKPPTWRIDE